MDAWLDTVPAGLRCATPSRPAKPCTRGRRLATATDAAVLLLCHTNRVATANARDRYGATGELRKKARMTLYAQTDEDGNLLVGPGEDEHRRRPSAASKFTITAVQHFEPTEDHDGTVPLLSYVGDSDRTAREHLAENYAAEHDPGAGDDAAGMAGRLPGRWPALGRRHLNGSRGGRI